jgi:hypothetical protein
MFLRCHVDRVDLAAEKVPVGLYEDEPGEKRSDGATPVEEQNVNILFLRACGHHSYLVAMVLQCHNNNRRPSPQ